MGWSYSSSTYNTPVATAGFYALTSAITIAGTEAVTTSNSPVVGTLTTGSSSITSTGSQW